MGLFDKIKKKKPDAGEGKTTEIFEDAFSAIQVDMVQICLEYVDNRADKIFIYASFEENTISCDFFYDINGHKIERNKLNLIDDTYDTSIQRQKMCMDILVDDMKQLISLCQKHERDIPTEIKITYDVNSNSLNANYQYGPVYSQYHNKTSDDIYEEWFKEISAT